VTVKSIVIDSSVALKWELRDEEATTEADRLLDDVLAGHLAAFVPTRIDYEIANALKVAVAKGRVTEADARTALADLQQYPIQRVDFLPMQESAFSLALLHERSVYDSAYIALAQFLGFWLYTGDKRLHNAIGSALNWVKWIGDYDLNTIPETKTPDSEP
jgi:predicted nucleic acid-binding protein